MIDNTLQKSAWLGMGATIGGILGYLIGDLVATNLENAALKDETPLLNEVDIYADNELVKPIRSTDDINNEDHGPIDYTRFYQKPPLEEVAGKTLRMADNIEAVRIITPQDWAEGEQDYDKVNVTFWKDQVFSIEDETGTHQVIADPNALFVPNVVLQFGNMSEDPDKVYIRNDKLDTDFEITRYSLSYKEEVLGEKTVTPTKPAARKRNRMLKTEKDLLEEGNEEGENVE